MEGSDTGPAAGVILAKGSTRVWVERDALYWRQGRTTVTAPGVQIRRVEVAGRSLAVSLFEGGQAGTTMTIRHRNEAAVAALAAEVEAISRDAGPSENPPPVRRQSVRVWPLRVMTGLSVRVMRGNPWWRAALWYLFLGFPLAVWLPVEPRFLGFLAWLLLPLSVTFLRIWVTAADLDTQWVLWRRGVTVRASFEPDPYFVPEPYSDSTSYMARFRTLDGQEVTAFPLSRGCRDEIRYDPRDPSRVLAPTRVAWLANALVAFVISGMWGVAFGIPAVLWLIRLLAVPF